MLKRKIYSEMLEWKSGHDKCLLIKGQRQVGKSYIVERFGENEYESFVKIDFSQDDSLVKLFSDRRVDEMVKAIGLYTGKEIIPGKTLLFLDEIQECPQAYSALKSFSLDGRYDVIASGSLIGVERKGKKTSADPLIPLGYETEITMYGLDFEEFLWAAGVKDDIIDEIKESIRSRTGMSAFILDRISKLFREYMIAGGMPESVQAYVDSGKFSDSERILDDILGTCIRDINRYNTGIDVLKTSECFESIPVQLAQSNKKFMYSRIGGGQGRRSADKFSENLLWIKQAGYGNYCHALKQPVMLLKANRVEDHFKVYLSDTGMLIRMYGGNASMAVYNGDTSVNMGAVAENAVA
ncbi:MAG: ATP-binding protein, partial [Candidatus Methanomethylophilaceae archaeon]|nr:ATP-binding protein [Candidatus Methanomethylophilaceae archaeon]